MIEESYYLQSGHRWLPITSGYFETVLVDFFGRPNRWWHLPLLYVKEGCFAIHIRPKAHQKRNGFTRSLDGKFRPVYWVDNSAR